MSLERFEGLGFVASYWNADPHAIAPLGVVRALAVQVAWGMAPSERTDPPDELDAWVDRCLECGLDVIPWAWCNASDPTSARYEGGYHAERCAELGFAEAFIANMEAPYDSAGDSSSVHYKQPDAYADGLLHAADSMGLVFEALAITTTPFFGSSTVELQQRGWATMPQAFVGDYPGATVAACVEHFEGWGWPVAQQRPLVQVYETGGVRPPTDGYLADSEAKGVGVVPYIVEQAMGGDGPTKLRELIPATWRPFASSPDDGGFDVTKIGSQDGVDASCNRLRDLDPGGTIMRKDAKGKWPPLDALAGTPLDTWKAYDKLQRALSILVEDHDAHA